VSGKDVAMETVPLIGLQREWVELGDELDAAIHRVIARSSFILGPEVKEFESAFAFYCGTAGAVGVASGTDAITLALAAAGLGEGDEVITSDLTSGATATAILRAGARPVLVDVDAATLNIDPGAVEAAIGSRTRAILPVHLYGRPADVRRLGELARAHDLLLIEDCAQAVGAQVGDRRAGSIGDVGCFSFYPTKNLGAYGDGGIVVSSNPDLLERARLLRTYGWTDRDFSAALGFNSRLDELQAAILATKLPHLDAWNRRRAQIAARYDAGFEHLEGVKAPRLEPGHAWHLYVVQVAARDEVRRRLAELGVATGVHYPVPLHRQPAFEEFGAGLRFPNTGAACSQIVSLPMFPQLLDVEVDRVIEAVRAAVSMRT
jgi:dTDP-4-amino-4,6-dideoxygalactose transaminase